MVEYIFFTFSPVQGFIEKSRKLRDLYGSSLILSKLSEGVATYANKDNGLTLVSPALIGIQQESRCGFPNQILFQVNVNSYKEDAEVNAYCQKIRCQFFDEWEQIIDKCNNWIKNRPSLWNWCQDISWKDWDREWRNWKNYAWETFFGVGKTVKSAQEDLEHRKLARNWVAINWIGESSSLSGADGIVLPKLGHPKRNPKLGQWGQEKDEVEEFYRRLALKTENKDPESQEIPEGKYIDPNERLSIPELVKRLVTLDKVSKDLEIPRLEKTFSDLVRRAQINSKYQQESDQQKCLNLPIINNLAKLICSQHRNILDNKEFSDVGQWTGWFIGDGDCVSEYILDLIDKDSSNQEEKSNKIRQFSQEMRSWGERFQREFDPNLGRVIYAGGDDFLGLIYNRKFPEHSLKSISGSKILNWLTRLPDEEWQKEKSEQINEKITLSVGFVWAAPAVPQRDILQHCREAQQVSKKKGRNRITIRVVFSQGRYVQWSTPWQYLKILQHYKDRDRNKNWNHVYNDLAQLQTRHAFGLGLEDKNANLPEPLLNSLNQDAMLDAMLNFVELYFPGYKTELKEAARSDKLFANLSVQERSLAMVRWLRDLIVVGWYLCSEEE